MKKAAETGEPYDLESLFIPLGSKDKIWVRSLGKAVYSGGKIVKLAGTFQNIDKYKRADEALRASEERFASVFRYAPLPIAITDPQDGHIIDVNDSYLRLIGYRREEVIGHTTLELGLWVDPGEREKLLAILREQGKVTDFGHAVRTKSGEIRYVLNSGGRGPTRRADPSADHGQ